MKRKNIFLRILIGILAFLVLVFIVLWVNGTNKDRKQTADISLSSWMSTIPDEAKLVNIAIPGSHDAGTKGILWLAETQSYSIKDQLSFGVRYFDIRVNKTEDGYPIYHSMFNGDDFREILKDIKEFIKNNPSETLILDFQHFKNDSKHDVYEMLRDELYSNDLVLVNDSDKGDLTYINELTLQSARGKCIIFFGETNEDPSNWVFLRNDDECTKDNMCLDSYYIGTYHKGGFNSLTQNAHPIYFEKLRSKKENNQNGIFVLQCQLTDGNLIFGPWAVERGMEDEMNEYINSLSNDSLNEYGLSIEDINVVLRDFLTPEKCQDIITINSLKEF